jgi:hypothetical protein
MANQDAPFGFRPVAKTGSSPDSSGYSEYGISSGYATAIYEGDAVKMTASGVVALLRLVIAFSVLLVEFRTQTPRRRSPPSRINIRVVLLLVTSRFRSMTTRINCFWYSRLERLLPRTSVTMRTFPTRLGTRSPVSPRPNLAALWRQRALSSELFACLKTLKTALQARLMPM